MGQKEITTIEWPHTYHIVLTNIGGNHYEKLH